MKWIVAIAFLCPISKADLLPSDWKKSSFEPVVRLKCDSSEGVQWGSGVVVDPHVVLTAGHVVLACMDHLAGIEVLDKGKITRSPQHAYWSKMQKSEPSLYYPGTKDSIRLSQDITILIFEKPLATQPISIEQEPHLASSNDMSAGDYLLVGFPGTFFGKRAERQFGELRLGGSKGVALVLRNERRKDLYPLLKGFFIELEINKEEDDNFLPGISGGAIVDMKSGKLLGLAVAFYPELDPRTKYGLLIDLTHPVRQRAFRLLKARFPFVFKATDWDVDETESAHAKSFSRSLFQIYKSL